MAIDSDEREATRRKLTMPLLDDGTHTRWVNDVFEICDKICDKEPSRIQDLLLFLRMIISTSEGRLNPKFLQTREVKNLFEKHPELVEKLRVAWKDRTLREISNLRTFCILSCTVTVKHKSCSHTWA